MDLEKGDGVIDSPIEVDIGSSGGPIIEPYVGMEFDSEDDARKFYVEYARRLGFVVRIMQRRRSGIDGRTLARRLGCNKQGFSPNQKGAIGPEKKPRPSAREGCNATILVKMEKSGKWVVTRFVKDHNHPLVVTANGFSTAEAVTCVQGLLGVEKQNLIFCGICNSCNQDNFRDLLEQRYGRILILSRR